MNLEHFKNPLTCQVKFYIPSVDMHGAKLNCNRIYSRVTRIQNKLTELFGGCTLTQGLGSYENIAEVVTTERVRMIEAFCSEDDLEKAEAELYCEAREIRDKLDQESVAIEINNQLYFV